MMTTLSTGGLLDRGWVVNPDAVASATASIIDGGAAHGCRALDLRVARGVDLRVLPDRGFDLGAAWYRGVPLAWMSRVGEAGPLDVPRGTEWLDRFGGGLVTTCGLSNVGEPSEGHGLHGRVSHLRARNINVERTVSDGEVELTATAQIDEASALGPHLRLRRRVTTRTGEGLITITDVTANLSGAEEPAPLLYHVNLGAPLWGPGARLELDVLDTVPRDTEAEAGVDEWHRPPEPEPGAPEQVFEHVLARDDDGWASAKVTNTEVGLVLTLRWDAATLGRFHQWRHPGQSVLGLEPANCSVGGRGEDRDAGRLPVLESGQERVTQIEVRVEEIA